MNSETSIIAAQTRLSQWTDDIRDCQNRPAGMKIEEWCSLHGISKTNYYYRLRRVRKACLDAIRPEEQTSFIELPAPEPVPAELAVKTAAVLRGAGGTSLEILDSASLEFIRHLLGAMDYVK